MEALFKTVLHSSLFLVSFYSCKYYRAAPSVCITINVEYMEIQPISKTSTLTHSRTTRVNSSSRQQDFVLNLDRAIAKKIEASRRDVNIQYEYTGGGVTGTIDAVTFELIKNAIMHYYEETNPDSYIIKIVEDKDKKSLVVSKVIRVYSCNTHLYTLSLFYTSCRLLVNGKNIHQFIDTDTPRIHEVIQSVTLNGNRINLKSMNETLYEQLTKIKQRQHNIIF